MITLKRWAASLALLLPISLMANERHDDFIQLMVKKHQLDADYVTSALAKASVNQKVLKAISSPWEAKPWHQYYPIFLTPKRINKGVEFWLQHADTLRRAEQQLGVDAAIIVAILGVETYYGKVTGQYSVLDSLYTLGFHYPPRAEFFKKELAQYLLLAKEENFQPAKRKGSYAGAMGWGQFISSSYRHYGIDFDNDGSCDLFNNPVDAIGSVANYFNAHGWRTGEPAAYKVNVDQHKLTGLLNKDLKLQHNWQQLLAQGVTLDNQQTGQLSPQSKAKLLQFELATGYEYWVGLHNFYVISRYNHSPLYAMAVYQLSQQIKQKVQQQIQSLVQSQ